MRILGIDLGSTSVKAVELDSAFGRYEIHEYHERPIPADGNPLEVARELIASLPKAPDRVAVSMKNNQVTFRNLQLPTRDKKAIQASVGFELEDELPFSLDQAVYDYTILSQAAQSTQLHVVATLRRHAETLLTDWAVADVDPDTLTTEAWAYRTLFNRVLGPGSQEKPILLVHSGHQKTLLYVHWRGVPVLAREIHWGGRDLATAICTRYSIPYDQAESTKLDNGFILPDSQRDTASAEQLEFSDTIQAPFEILLQAIRQTQLTAKNLTRHDFVEVYTSGGTSLLPGFGAYLQEKLQVNTRPLQALSSIATSGVTYSEHTDAAFSLAGALALCMVGSDRGNAINLRKGPLSKSSRRRDLNLTALKNPLMALGAISLCFFVSQVVQRNTYQSQLQDTDVRLEKSIRAFFGQLSSSAVRTYMSNTSTLKASVTKELNKQRELSKLLGPNPHSPIDALKEVSASVPRDVVVDMTNFQVGAAPTAPFSLTDSGTMSLTFLVSNPQMAEKLATILGSKMTAIQRSPTEEVASTEGQKKWKVTFSGKPTEDSYGKQ